MNTLTRTSTSAVITRLHDVNGPRGCERSGFDGGPSRPGAAERGGGRGRVRGAGRQHTTTYMSVVD
ncbi:SigE family RNA polymerase sigma factor, partial [Streptomyces sp. TRM76130]|nr:SigE family RNA polymerase sigma factor [Streptomyces sp. TRM76130]